MKKVLKILAILAFLAFVGLQFVRPDRTNPPVDESKTIEASLKIPKEVSAILNRSCNDCHSNKTEYPWYSNVAPVSWSVVDHIRVGREDLNFSIWATYSKKRQDHKLEEICEMVEEREMPHYQYLWIHWEAALTDKDIKLLCDWTKRSTVEIGESR